MLTLNETAARHYGSENVRRANERLASLNINEHWDARPKAGGHLIDVIDFFSGCGGMSAGFLSANAITPTYKVVMAVDIDKDANSTYSANIGLEPHALDVATLAANPKKTVKLINSVRSSSATPLVLIGCAPCQGFSSHRDATGESDARNSLFVSFAKIAAAVQPDVVVIENVPEILSDRYWPLVSEARQILERAGYVMRVSVHDMAEFGVPQHRFRALMIAMKKQFKMPEGFLQKGSFRTVRDAIGHLQKIEPGQVSLSDPMHFTARHRASTVDTIMAVPTDGGSRPWDAGPECLRRAKVKSGRAAYEDVYGRLWWDRPAITITAYARNPASGRYSHPTQHRGLSVREAALLQGFPASYQFSGAFDSRFRQIGNAVPPAFAAHLACYILGQLTSEEAPSAAHTDITESIGPSFSRLIPSLKAGHRSIGQRHLRLQPTRAA